ncbi:MAG TPA: hypothetical protein VFU81_07235, partial [Thermomicrobiales bacterium]|nr:hypothetical protein [Thermomicrobiales bacterium]
MNTDGTSHDLTIHSPSTTFSGRVGGAAGGAIGNLAVDGLTAGAGTTTFRVAGASPATPTVLTSANQTYGNAVVLGDNTVLSSSAGGTIAFHSTIDGDGAGPWSLTVDTSGDTLFGDGAGGDFIGKLHPLASLSTSGGGATKFNVLGSTAASPTVTTAGPQTYGDNVVLLADAVLISTVDNAPIVFQGTVDAAVAGGAALTVDATGGRPSGKFGVVQFNANVGTTALSSLTVLSGGPFTLAGGLTLTAQNGVQITVAEATPLAGGDDLIVNGAIQSLAGSIELDAADNLAINAPAQLTSPASVTLRGDFNNNDAPPGCTILLAGTINSPVTNVFGGAGNDTINVQKTTAGVTTVDAGAGDDTINVSSTAPAAGGLTSPIAAAVVVAGGAGADKLNVDDSGDAAANVSGALTSTSL